MKEEVFPFTSFHSSINTYTLIKQYQYTLSCNINLCSICHSSKLYFTVLWVCVWATPKLIKLFFKWFQGKFLKPQYWKMLNIFNIHWCQQKLGCLTPGRLKSSVILVQVKIIYFPVIEQWESETSVLKFFIKFLCLGSYVEISTFIWKK